MQVNQFIIKGSVSLAPIPKRKLAVPIHMVPKTAYQIPFSIFILLKWLKDFVDSKKIPTIESPTKRICVRVSCSLMMTVDKKTTTIISSALIGSIMEIFPTLNASKSSNAATNITNPAVKRRIKWVY